MRSLGSSHFVLRPVCLFVNISQLKTEGHALLGEKVACATVSPHLSLLSYIPVQCYPPLWQLHCDFRDFNNGVCHVLKITTADSSPDMGLLQ